MPRAMSTANRSAWFWSTTIPDRQTHSREGRTRYQQCNRASAYRFTTTYPYVLMYKLNHFDTYNIRNTPDKDNAGAGELTCLGVQDVVERPELHVLTDDDQVRRLGARPEHRQDVRVVKDPEGQQVFKGDES